MGMVLFVVRDRAHGCFGDDGCLTSAFLASPDAMASECLANLSHGNGILERLAAVQGDDVGLLGHVLIMPNPLQLARGYVSQSIASRIIRCRLEGW